MKLLLIRISLFLLGLLGLNFLLAYALGVLERDVDKRGYAFDRYRWEEFYQLPQGNSLDILFLGSSHAYRGFDPQLLEEWSGIKSFNLGSSGQTPLTSLHVLHNAIQHQRPKMVVMELYFYTFLEADQLNNGGNNWLQLRNSTAKWKFLWEAFDGYEMSALTCLPILRRKNALPYVLRKYLRGDDHLDHAGIYKGKGYVERREQISAEKLKAPDLYDQLKLGQDWALLKHQKAIREIAKLCVERGIELRFISSPMPQITVGKIQDQAQIDSLLQQLTTSVGADYRNDTQNPALGLVDSLHFFDNNHLNAEGVKIWNRQLLDFLSP